MEVPAADRALRREGRARDGLHEAMADAATWFTEQLHGIAGAEARACAQAKRVDRRATSAPRSASASPRIRAAS